MQTLGNTFPNTFQYNDINSSPTMLLESLKLQETGTYNTQFRRPFTAVMDAGTVQSLANRVDRLTQNDPSTSIQPGYVAGLCSGIMVPNSSVEGEVAIHNGWQQRRFRFVLTVKVPSHFMDDIYIFQGYSEYFDISLQGSIDPNMNFFMNSYVRIQRNKSPQNTMGLVADRIVESQQFIDGTVISPMANQVVKGLRPSDIIAGLQTGYMNNAMGGTIAYDTRCSIGNDMVGNVRKNCIPSEYLARTITQHRSSQALADYGYGNENIFDRTWTSLAELEPYENPLIRQLTDNRQIMKPRGSFTINDLIKIDPTFQSRIAYTPVAQNAFISNTGIAAPLYGATVEVLMANMIAYGIGALMSEAGLCSVSFITSTMTPNGMVETKMLAPGVIMGTTTAELAYAKFIDRFNTVLVPDLTKNNLIPFSATVEADMFNDVKISIMVEGSTMETFIFPLFCDSLNTPIVTQKQENFDNMVSSIDDILRQCGFDTNPVLGSAVSMDI